MCLKCAARALPEYLLALFKGHEVAEETVIVALLGDRAEPLQAPLDLCDLAAHGELLDAREHRLGVSRVWFGQLTGRLDWLHDEARHEAARGVIRRGGAQLLGPFPRRPHYRYAAAPGDELAHGRVRRHGENG